MVDTAISIFSVFLQHATRLNEALPGDPTVRTGVETVLCLFLMTLLYRVWRERILAEEGTFDGELWDRILSLVFQHRTKDAAALAETTPGVFAELYLAALDYSAQGREDAADAMESVLQEHRQRQGRARALLAGGAAACLAAGAAGSAISLMPAAEGWSAAGLNALTNFSPDLWPLMAGISAAAVTGLFRSGFTRRGERLAAHLRQCGLKLLATLLESSRDAVKKEAAKPVPAPKVAPEAPLPLPSAPKVLPAPTGLSVWETLTQHHL